MKSLLRVLRYIRPYWRLAALTFAAAGAAAALELLPPWLVKLVIDDVIGQNQISLLPWLIGGLLLAQAGKNLAASLRIRFNNTLEQQVIYDLRSEVFAALQRLSISYFENRSTGEIMSRINNDVEHVERIFIDGLESLLMSSLTLVGISIILFSLNWKLAALSLLPIPVLVYSASGRFNQRSKAYSESNLRVMKLWSMYSPSMIFIGSLGSAIILWYGTGEVIKGNLTVGELVAFLGYLALFYVPINQIHSVNHMLQHALAAGDRVFEMLDTKPEVVDRPHLFKPSQKVAGDVAARKVWFHYRPDIPVLKGIDFEVTAGERIALVGPSGAGKSTLIKLLMRFYDVTEGAILLDGKDIRELPLAYVREQMGLVQQEPFLFNGTVKENIAYGNLTASQAEIEEVARIARAHEFIAELPEKYETWIGSNIDTETEIKIREALEELTRGRTTFIIAHRLSTLRHVDRIFVLDGGRLVEEGSHPELIARSGVYRALYDAQFQI
ncbi:MAG: hypothetical protein AUH96_03360 [Nitrospirae bacterium 13_2_20CM_2_61_4]|nr:MAG: hypothetical protein AUH96_03360 [Nitrospirae bacterium 13_2_20CM_2_61_4]